MFSILKFEIKRAFINRFFITAVILGCLISVLQTIDYSLNFAFDMGLAENYYPQSVFNSYIGLSMWSVWTYVFYMIFPLLAALPYAGSFLSDNNGGFVKVIFTRVNKGKYLMAKLIAVFLSGGVTVVLPLLLNLFLTLLCVPAVITDVSTGTFPIFGDGFAATLYYSHPFAYIFIYDLIIFVCSGVFACTALAFSYFVKYKYVVIISPFLLFMTISYGSKIICPNSPFDISEWIFPVQQSQSLDLGVVIIELLVIFMISCFIYFYKGIKNDTI